MKKPVQIVFHHLLVLSFLLAALSSCQPGGVRENSYSPEMLLAWNEKIIALAIEEDKLLTLKGVRTEALVHLAVHNALNTIKPVYTRYGFEGNQAEADPYAASAQAAFELAIISFPAKAPELKALLDSCLAGIPEGEAKNEGIQLGKSTASHILQARSQDSWDAKADYTWHPMAPGVYAEFHEHSGTPEGFIFGAGWAAAEPFMSVSENQFRSPPPPEITSDAYTKAFEEVKQYGSSQSELRTADQAHLAMWWKDFVEHSHNRLARDLIQREELNLWEAARALALLNMSIFDAYIHVFDNKFHYNHWRPFTAIRWAANDENPDTEEDPDWNNLHKHTYAFPSYPSAHGTASSTAMRVLSNTLGTGDQYAFSMRIDSVDAAGPFSAKVAMSPPTRSFSSFTEAGLEASLSRVYLGIHFRYDSEEGHRLGNEIGDYANANFLTPVSLRGK